MSWATTQNYRHKCNCDNQNGAALAISLILMAVLTILGLQSMRGARHVEILAHNSQQKLVAFEAAESALLEVHSLNLVKDSIDMIATELLSEPDPVEQSIVSSNVSSELDQFNALGKSIDVTVTSSIQYCGESTPINTDLNADESQPKKVGLLFDLRASADIENSGARSLNVMRTKLNGLSTGRQGKCTLPH